MDMTGLRCLPCVDDEGRSDWARRTLDVDREWARQLGMSAVEAIDRGTYQSASGRIVDWSDQIARARSLRRSIAPDDELGVNPSRLHTVTEVQVVNATTFQAAKVLVDRGERPLSLNFANGVSPGGGFLNGARAQEEGLCRASALHATLEGDPMYAHHRQRPEPDSTDWVILSPEVPVFRDQSGAGLEKPWLFDVITSAAPVASRVGQPRSGDLLERRIHRVLEVAAAFSYDSLVLGAWGCGAFGNDPVRTADDFARALELEFRGCFERVVFAITDWSPARKFLGPFRDRFSA